MHDIDAYYEISQFDSLVHCTHIPLHEATATRRKKTNRLSIMTKQIISRAAAGLALTLLATAAFAGEPAAIDNTKTVGALTLETQGLATDTGSVHRQGGYALPGAVQWKVPASDDRVQQAAAF